MLCIGGIPNVLNREILFDMFIQVRINLLQLYYENQLFCVFVFFLNFSIFVDDSIAIVKSKIQARGIDVGQQQLVYRGNILADAQTVAALELPDYSGGVLTLTTCNKNAKHMIRKDIDWNWFTTIGWHTTREIQSNA